LILQLFRKLFAEELDWPATIMEQGLQKNLDANDLVEMIFRFRSLLLNFIESCPIELIEKEFFTSIFDSLVALLP
jgi:hypothetical protein